MIPERAEQAKGFFNLLCWTLLLEKWPLGNSAQAKGASLRPGLLARRPGRSKVTLVGLPVLSDCTMLMGSIGWPRPETLRATEVCWPWLQMLRNHPRLARGGGSVGGRVRTIGIWTRKRNETKI